MSADSPALQSLLRKSNDYMSGLYPAASNHLEDVETLLPPAGFLIGVYGSGAMIGCGAVKHVAAARAAARAGVGADSSCGEIKRVFVLEEHRRKGISKAIGLYRRLGYVERPPFGRYDPDPLSIFMEKQLGA